MKRYTRDTTQDTGIYDYDNSFPRVIKFGSDVFRSLIPSPPYFQSLNNVILTTAINPQDVILNQETALISSPVVKTNRKQVPLDSVLMISPARYSETVRSPYLNFEDIFFDASPTDTMFSIGCPDSSSGSSICSSNSQEGLSPTEKFNFEESLPPSSAILQSQLNNSSLDYLIKNNSFIEEIKSSLTVEQQQYINSGVTKLTSTYSCTTTSSKPKESFDLATPDFSHDHSVYQPDLTAYADIFKDNDGYEYSCSDFSISVSDCSYNDGVMSDLENGLDDEDSQPLYPSTEKSETRLRSLLNILNNLNNGKDFSNIQNTLEQVKAEYISEITNAFIYNHQSPRDGKLTDLCSSVIKAYNSANRIVTKYSAEKGCTEVQEISRKRKVVVTKKHQNEKATKKNISRSPQQRKKNRKNYDPDSITALMDCFLKNNGKAPSNESRRTLAEITGKSDIQSK